LSGRPIGNGAPDAELSRELTALPFVKKFTPGWFPVLIRAE
jgi:hypothetical protein